ncbi:rho guanine nucleotide exchange factor 19-like [Protopterus annectens]|uniref:rho guanine nucleotide exchange factor 19-like n=1 Tax=Protopterus annectens TaxID=7888 RepID=UPI001CFA16FC|nr:rho guanine nucleotide exchange factor 19-like [Protopterus annectens]
MDINAAGIRKCTLTQCKEMTIDMVECTRAKTMQNIIVHSTTGGPQTFIPAKPGEEYLISIQRDDYKTNEDSTGYQRWCGQWLLPTSSESTDIHSGRATFEVITSEASYLRSLNVVVNHFKKSRELSEVLCSRDRHTLFSNIQEVKDASESFLLELEEHLEKNVFLTDISKIVLKHCPPFRKVYVPYVTNQMYQEQLMQQLGHGNMKFLQVLRKLEEQPLCQRQLLKSFLVLPFQRITRLKLLLENILKLTVAATEPDDLIRSAIKAVGEIVLECNDNVRKMKQTEELVRLETRLEFPKTKSIPLISRDRWLVREGELAQIKEVSGGCGTKYSMEAIYLHLFNDLLLLSRKKV